MSARLVSPLFVGRHGERTELIDTLATAADGTTQFVLVGGEAGVGKSRLVAELVEHARARDVRVLSGQCVQLGADGVPFAPLVDALRALARSMPRAEFDRALGPARRLLLRLLPNIDPDPDDAAIGPVVQSSQLLELVLGMLERLAGTGPVLIVIEDLHWADQSTLDLVAYLVRAMRSVPVAVVGTFRSDEMNRRHPLRTLLLGWERGRSVASIELSRLDRDEVAAQLDAILGHAAEANLLESVYERSEGNPFLVEEVLGVVQAGGLATALPQSLRDLLLSRVDGLGSAAQQLIATAAVGGRWVSERLLLTVSGMDEGTAFAGLREAVEQHVLVVDDAGRGYSFRHALARDAVYDDMLPGQRGRLHAAYGDALSADPDLAGDDRGALAADLAHHWYAALDLPRALGAALQAAIAAAARFAPAESLTQLERALQIWPRVPAAETVTGTDHVDVLRRAAQAAQDAGEVTRSLSLLGEALDELGEHGDPERRAGLMERRALGLMQVGESTQGIAVLRDAAGLLPAEGDTVAHAAVFVELANATFRTGSWDEADRLARRAAVAARSAGATRLLVEAEITMAVVQVIRGDHDGGVAAARSAIDAAVRLGHHHAAMRGFINLSDVLDRLGRSADAAELAAEGRLVAERSGYARSSGAFLAGNETESLTHLGRYGEAAQLASTVLAYEPEGIFAATLLDARCVTALCQGRYDQARADVARARDLIGEQVEPQWTRAFTITDVRLRLADGDRDGAMAILVDTFGEAAAEPRYDWVLLWLAFATHADRVRAALDRGRDTPALDPVFVAARNRLGTDIEPQRAYDLMCGAELSRAEGDRDAGQWHAAAQLWRDMQRPYEQSTCLLRAAETLAAAGERASAQSDAAEAYRLATGIGATPLTEQIAHLARRARLAVGSVTPDDGEPVRADPLRRFGLTHREDEVLAMVADGRTNPEIAKALFISPKTASVHVSNILAKLGVTSRVEAATMAQRLRPPAS